MADVNQSDDLHSGEPVPIVAIGASAGGLEPCEQFFLATPVNLGVAYVVVQHLSPDFRSLMDELLGRHSSMPIYKAEHGRKLEPDCIYLNAPRQAMRVVDGRFVVTEGEDTEDTRMPINTFLTSMAQEVGSQGIAVILSGSANDGMLGSLRVRDAGGCVFVQDPSTAKFDSMPNSAINAGVANAIAAPDVLPELIMQQINGSLADTETIAIEAALSNPLEAILDLLRDRFGTDFAQYKSETILRRLRRRSELMHVGNLVEYYRLLLQDDNEVELCCADLLIQVTTFFRDTEAFDLLRTEVIPNIAARMASGEQVRVWVPGCSSGEEAYSIAMLVSEFAREHDIPLNLKVLATDVHSRALETANAGVYNSDALEGLSDEFVERYLEPHGAAYKVRPHLRRLVVFSNHNLLRDPPFTRMDLVSCRNVLIYLTDAAQKKTMAMFHFALRQNGVLFLGPSESIGALGSEFRTLNRRWRIFEKTRDVRLAESVTLMASSDAPRAAYRQSEAAMTGPASRAGRSQQSASDHHRSVQIALERILRDFAPAGFLVNQAGALAHVFGQASRYLRIEDGSFSTSLDELVIGDLQLVISSGLDRIRNGVAVPFSRDVPLPSVPLAGGTGEPSRVRVSIAPVEDKPSNSPFFLVTIEPLETPPALETIAPLGGESEGDSEVLRLYSERVKDLETSLRSTEESLQTTIEELETSNEELQATNEELMASNEELQSTNEELHSVNEELYTVSSEHQRKIDELTQMSSDMEHLLKSTGIGTIFLDEELRIRRFTPAASRTFNLIAQDIGRPIAHVTARFDAEDLLELIDQTLDTQLPAQREVVADGVEYLLRLLPYLPEPDRPMGMVITSVDIDDLRRKSSQGSDTRHVVIPSERGELLVRWDAASQEVTYVNGAFAAFAGRRAADMVGEPIDLVCPSAFVDAVAPAIDQVTQVRPMVLNFTAHDARHQVLSLVGAMTSLAATGSQGETMQVSLHAVVPERGPLLAPAPGS